jgi:aryl-alcohol dehydrogenase-like predicted oxidoreductase
VKKIPTYLEGNPHECQRHPEAGRLVCGTSGLGGVWRPVDEQESVDAILLALESGIDIYDTSPSYHRAEIYLGKALSEWKGARPFISSKAGRLPAQRADDLKVNFSAVSMKNSLLNTLERLGIGNLDLLFLHEPFMIPASEWPAILETLQSFREEGLVRYLGLGGNPAPEFQQYITRSQFQFISGFLRLDACNLNGLEYDIPLVKQENLVYHAAAPLHMGLLTERLVEFLSYPPETEWISNKDLQSARGVAALAIKWDLPLPELAFRFILSIAEADRLVMGPTNLKEMQQNLEFYDKGILPKENFEAIVQNWRIGST